jgi:hypothetical protein
VDGEINELQYQEKLSKLISIGTEDFSSKAIMKIQKNQPTELILSES